MEVVKVKYKLFPFIPIHLYYIKQVPEKWDEANANNLLSIAKYISQAINERIFITEFIGIPKKILKYISDFELWKMAQCVTLLEKRESLNKLLISSFHAGNSIFKSPKPLLKNVKFGDFILFDSYYMAYTYGNQSALDKFISHLYQCDENDNDIIYKMISNIDDSLKYAIFINYGMIRQWLASRYTYVFQQSKTKKNSKKKKENNWLPVLDALMINDLANAEKYEKLPLHTVLRNLNLKIKEGYKRG